MNQIEEAMEPESSPRLGVVERVKRRLACLRVQRD